VYCEIEISRLYTTQHCSSGRGLRPLASPLRSVKKEGGWVVRANVRFLESLEGAPIRANAYGGLYSSLERTRIAASERAYRNADLSDEWVVSAARIG